MDENERKIRATKVNCASLDKAREFQSSYFLKTNLFSKGNDKDSITIFKRVFMLSPILANQRQLLSY